MYSISGFDPLICYINYVEVQVVQLQVLSLNIVVYISTFDAQKTIDLRCKFYLALLKIKSIGTDTRIITAFRKMVLNFNKISATCHCFSPAKPDPFYWHTQQVNQLRSKENTAKHEMPVEIRKMKIQG